MCPVRPLPNTPGHGLWMTVDQSLSAEVLDPLHVLWMARASPSETCRAKSKRPAVTGTLLSAALPSSDTLSVFAHDGQVLLERCATRSPLPALLTDTVTSGPEPCRSSVLQPTASTGIAAHRSTRRHMRRR